MKKLFCSVIFFVSFLNLFSQQEQSKKKILSGDVNDTTKTKIISTGVDSTKTVIKEKLIPLLPIKTLSTSGNILNSDKLQKLDSRYTGNYFSYIPFGFVRDLGSIGQPNEVVIYGNGFGSSSFLMNGININNRLTNSLDLNLFQSESIDSIEIIPLAQGFLYNEMNNPVSVNFISREFVTSKPFTRIRFYQAPNEEGFFDGIFSSNISRRLSIYTELTHQSTDPRFKNSDYGMWAASVRLKYLLNNNFNITGSYSYYQSNVGLNGGIDLDSIKLAFPANQTEEILFSTIQAPVNYPDRYQKVSGNNFNIKLLANLIGNKPTDLTLYYQSALVEFRQNEFTSLKRDTWRWDWPWRYDKITNNNKFNTYGAKLSQEFETSLFNIYSEALYESTRLTTPLVNRSDRLNSFSAMAKASLIISKDKPGIIPSIFGKYLNYDGVGYLGAGADVSWRINYNFSVYAGISKYRKPYDQIRLLSGNNQSDYSIIESSIIYRDNKIDISAGYFLQALSSNSYNEKTLHALNLKLNWHIWKIVLATNTSYYIFQEFKDNYPLPDFTSNGGIYYVDTLFNSNLKLKAGINYWLIGNRGYQFINFETSEITRYVRTNSSIIPPYVDVKPSVQFDFFLAGKIQDAATIYFVFENLLNERYYIVPYFPKQERGIRLGVSWEFLD